MSVRFGSFRFSGSLVAWLALAGVVVSASWARGDKPAARGAAPARVEARSFVLRDEAGRVRATLGFGDEESVLLSLGAADGRTAARLSVNGDGHVQLAMIDPKGNERLELALDNHGPSLRLYPERRTPAIELLCGSETGSAEADTILFALQDPKSGIGCTLGVEPGETVYQAMVAGNKRGLALRVNRDHGATIGRRDGKQSSSAKFE